MGRLEELLYEKWKEITGEQTLVLLSNNDGGIELIRYAVNGNPLTEYEKERIEFLKKNSLDIRRHGDMTLFVRGLLESIIVDGREYVGLTATIRKMT